MCKHEHGMCQCIANGKAGCGGDEGKCMCKEQMIDKQGIQYVNLTGDDVTIISPAGVYNEGSEFKVDSSDLTVLSVYGHVHEKAKVSTSYHATNGLGLAYLEFTAKHKFINLPDPKQCIRYIVPMTVFKAAKALKRTDVVTPCNPVYRASKIYRVKMGYLGFLV